MDNFSINYYLKVNYKYKTNKELAEKLNISIDSVKYHLSKAGLTRPSKYSYNERFFQYWTQDMSYFLGFLFGDGYLCHRHSYLAGIEISIKDINILTKMADKLGIVPMSISKRDVAGQIKKYCKISLYSKDMYNDLLNRGLFPNKSLVVEFPEVPPKYLSSFIRGYFDADGCISIWPGGKDCFICCSYPFGYFLDSILNEYGIETIKPKQSSILKVRLSSKKENLKRFFNFMYSNCDLSDGLYLKRKYDKFLLCI